MLSKLLTFYCKRRGVRYKQGLHEILVPFMMLTEEEGRLKESEVSNLFYAFILKFLPHIYNDEDFNSLQCSFKIYRLLLQYHDPDLCNALDRGNMGPELYATPWLMTLWAHGLPLSLLFKVWDFYLLEDNVYIHHFVALALLMQSREVLLNADSSDLPLLLKKLVISEENLNEICSTAKSLLTATPRSICKSLFKVCYDVKPPEPTVLQLLESSSCLSLGPEELLKQVVPHSGVPDATRLKFIILDVRPRDEFNSAHVVSSTHINPTLLSPDCPSPEELDATLKYLKPLKGHHFCFIGSSVNEMEEAETIEEFDMVKKINTNREDGSIAAMARFLLNRGFPHISHLEGGFDTIINTIDNSKGALQIHEIVQSRMETPTDKKDKIDVTKKLTASLSSANDMMKKGLGSFSTVSSGFSRRLSAASEKVSEKVSAASEKVSAKIEKLATVTAAEGTSSLTVPKKDLSKYLGQWWAKRKGEEAYTFIMHVVIYLSPDTLAFIASD
jgi:hypothetical protein